MAVARCARHRSSDQAGHGSGYVADPDRRSRRFFGFVSFAETLLNIIPKNPIGALANGEMLQVIVFALIVGVILAKLQDKTQLVTNFFQQGNDIMMEMTMMVMGLAPIGVFCLIA